MKTTVDYLLNFKMKKFLILLMFIVISCSNGSKSSFNEPNLKQKLQYPPVTIKPVPQIEPVFQRGKLETLKPYLTLAAGVITHLTFGTLYCWGNFVSYTPPNLKYFGQKHTQSGSPDALILLPLNIIAQAVTSPLGPRIQKRLGSRKTIMLGSVVMCTGIFLSSFTQNLAVFALLYGCMYGFGIGMAYSAPLIAGWQWFPNAKGLVTGLVLTGFGSGAFFFNKVGSWIANPNNLNLVNGAFPNEVYARFPRMLRILAAAYLTLGMTASLLIFQPRETRMAEIRSLRLNQNREENKKALQYAMESREFKTLWVIIMLSAQSGINTIGIYKTYASLFDNLYSDKFQSILGGVASLCNGVGRIIWGAIIDQIGFQKTFMLCTVLQIICMGLFPQTTGSKLLYALAVCIMFFCIGGNFTIAPTASVSIWGTTTGPTAFGYLFSSFSTASLLAYFLTKQLVQSVGWDNVFRSLSFLSIIALILLGTLRQSPKK